MTVYIHGHVYDEMKGRTVQEAKSLIPKMRIEEPYSPEERAFFDYWQGLRMRQLVEKDIEYVLKHGGTVDKFEEALNQLPSYDDPPPYDINKIGKRKYEKHIKHLEQIRQGLINREATDISVSSCGKTYLSLNPKGWNLARKSPLYMFIHSLLNPKLKGMKPLCKQLAIAISQEYSQGYTQHFHIVPFDGPPFYDSTTHEGFINAILDEYIIAIAPTEGDFNTFLEYIPNKYWHRTAVIIPSSDLMNGLHTGDIGFVTFLNKGWHDSPEE